MERLLPASYQTNTQKIQIELQKDVSSDTSKKQTNSMKVSSPPGGIDFSNSESYLSSKSFGRYIWEHSAYLSIKDINKPSQVSKKAARPRTYSEIANHTNPVTGATTLREKRMLEIKTSSGMTLGAELPVDLANLDISNIIQSALNGNTEDSKQLALIIRGHVSESKFDIQNGEDYSQQRIEGNIVVTAGQYSISIGSSYVGLDGYYKDRNEDRLVLGVNSTSDIIVAIDGLGGLSRGDVAASILANAFFNSNPKNLPDSEIVALARDYDWGDASMDSAAAMASSRISGVEGFPNQRHITFNQVGDCNMVLFKRNKMTNEIIQLLATEDPGFTIIDRALNHTTEVSQETGKPLPKQPPSQIMAYFFQYRNMMHSTFCRDENELRPLEWIPSITIEMDDNFEYLLIGGSDGLFDNILPEELAYMIEYIGSKNSSMPLQDIIELVKEYHELRFKEDAIIFLNQAFSNSSDSSNTTLINLSTFLAQCIEDCVPLTKLEGFPSRYKGYPIESLPLDDCFKKEIEDWYATINEQEISIREKQSPFNALLKRKSTEIPNYYGLAMEPKSDNLTLSVTRII
ncbi:hypothetical protein HOG98_03630 [bacterium]|jgi:hypothetical protein|nr:hypothetical protein [bacterium]